MRLYKVQWVEHDAYEREYSTSYTFRFIKRKYYSKHYFRTKALATKFVKIIERAARKKGVKPPEMEVSAINFKQTKDGILYLLNSEFGRREDEKAES